VREGELSRQVSTLKAERSTLMVDLDATRRQVGLVQAAHAKAAETANRNYAVAKDLEQALHREGRRR
jgi:outer membrane murein-binding lipoprotein Lpp